MASGSGVTVIISGQDDLGPVLDKVEERLRRSGVAGQSAGNAIGGGMAHGAESTRGAALAFGALEGRIPIRALEKFIGMIPGMASLLAAAFPLGAALAFGAMMAQRIAEWVQMRKEAMNTGTAIEKAYRDMHAGAAVANDELRITNDRLENEIAKLEHKPENNLKLAIDEDRKSVDLLAQSIDEATKKSADLLKEHSIGAVKGFFTGQDSTSDVAGTVNYYRDSMAAAGSDFADATAKGDKAAAEGARKNLTNAQNAYASWIDSQIKMRTGMVKDKDFVSQYGTITPGQMLPYARVNGDQGANLAILRGERTSLNDQAEHAALQSNNGILQVKKGALEAAKGHQEAADKMREAQDKLAAAELALADANAKRIAQAQASQAQGALAANEQAHRLQLQSDAQYYRDKAAIQADAIRAQQTALYTQEANLQGQADRLSGQRLSGAKSVERNAQVAQIKAKIVELDGQSAKLTAEQAANTAALAENLDALAQKKTADLDRGAAQLETVRGGSTAARSRQSRDEYQQRRQSLVAEFGGEDNEAVRSADDQQRIDQARIGVTGAQQTYDAGESGIGVQRKGIDDQLARGQISGQQAQQQRIALDQEEAAALQPVLEAYRQLAEAGDLGAASQAQELQERIRELQNPVNEVAAQMREQFGGAFENLFEDIDKGKSALLSFLGDIRKDITKDVYQQFVQPAIQSELSRMIPNGGPQMGQGASGAYGTPSIASATGGLLGRFLSPFTGGTPKAAGGGGVNIQLINQTSQPAQATTVSGGTDDMTDKLRAPVTQILLQDLESNGSIAQSMSGLGGLLGG